MQQLSIGATLSGGESKKSEVTLCQKFPQFHEGFTDSRSVGKTQRTNLVGDDIQLYDTSRSGSGLLADDVEHFSH